MKQFIVNFCVLGNISAVIEAESEEEARGAAYIALNTLTMESNLEDTVFEGYQFSILDDDSRITYHEMEVSELWKEGE